MRRDDAIDTLLELGVSHNALTSFPSLPSDVEALLIYASQERGDAVPGSDLNLLALVTKPRTSTYAGDVNVSYYTRAHLTTGVGACSEPISSETPRLSGTKRGS